MKVAEKSGERLGRKGGQHGAWEPSEPRPFVLDLTVPAASGYISFSSSLASSSFVLAAEETGLLFSHILGLIRLFYLYFGD